MDLVSGWTAHLHTLCSANAPLRFHGEMLRPQSLVVWFKLSYLQAQFYTSQDILAVAPQSTPDLGSNRCLYGLLWHLWIIPCQGIECGYK